MSSAKNATAKFSAIPYALTIKIVNSGGSGSVIGNGGYGKCSSSSCSENFTYGNKIVLTASPDSGSKFFGWSGACSGAGECSITMDQAKEIKATFSKAEKVTYSLSLSVSGSGYIKITNPTSGIECDSSCGTNYEKGQIITIAAVPNEGYKFSRWEGDTCAGSNQECRVDINRSKSIKAYFEKK